MRLSLPAVLTSLAFAAAAHAGERRPVGWGRLVFRALVDAGLALLYPGGQADQARPDVAEQGLPLMEGGPR